MERHMEILRDLRQDSDKTQQEIAEVLGTSQTMYARYERGANELPLRHLAALCRYYGVSSDHVLGLQSKEEAALLDALRRLPEREKGRLAERLAVMAEQMKGP